MGACMLVRREAVEQVGPLDEAFFLFSEETDWAYRFREAGWKVVFFPGAECVHVGGASHGGRHVPRERPRPPALPRQAPRRRATPSARGGCCALAAGLRGRLFRGERGRMYRDDGATGSGRRGSRSCSTDDARPARRSPTVVLLLARARSWRGRSGQRSVSATLAWSLALVFGALAVTFAVGSSLTLTLVLLLAAGLVSIPFALRAPRPERIPGRRGVFAAGAVLGLLLWHVAGEHRRRRALPPRARPEARRVRLALARGRQRVRGRRPPSRLRVPALARLPRPRREGRLPRSRRGRRCTRRRCWRRWRCSSRTRPAGRSSGGSARRSPSSCGAGRRDGARARPRRRLHGARAAGDGLAPDPAARRARAGARLRRDGRAAACSRRSPRRGSCWRSSTRRTRSSSGCRSRASSSFARSSSGARRGGSPPRSRRSSSRRRSISRGCSRSSATRARTRPAWTSCSARSGSTPASSTSSPTRATGSRPRCSAEPARSRSRRSCSSRSPGSRCGAAGRPTSSAASSPSPR